MRLLDRLRRKHQEPTTDFGGDLERHVATPWPVAEMARVLEDDDDDEGGMTSTVTLKPYDPSFMAFLQSTPSKLVSAYMLLLAGSNPWEVLSWRKYARDCSSIPLRITGGAGADSWSRRLSMPNPQLRMGALTLLSDTYAQLEATGTAVWLLQKSPRRGEPPYIRVLPSMHVTVKVDSFGDPLYYLYQPNTQEQKKYRYNLDEIIVFRSITPIQQAYGMPHALALRQSYAMMGIGQEWNLNFLLNGANIPGVISTTEFLGPTEMRELRRKLRESYMGYRNNGIPPVLPQGVTWTSTGAAPRDVEFQDGLKFARNTILSAHDVPESLAGVSENSTSSTVKEDYRRYWQDSVLGRVGSVADQLQAALQVLTLDPSLTVVPDVVHHHAFVESPESRRQRIVAFVRFGVATANEARAEYGMPPIEGGDELMPVVAIAQATVKKVLAQAEAAHEQADATEAETDATYPDFIPEPDDYDGEDDDSPDMTDPLNPDGEDDPGEEDV